MFFYSQLLCLLAFLWSTLSETNNVTCTAERSRNYAQAYRELCGVLDSAVCVTVTDMLSTLSFLLKGSTMSDPVKELLADAETKSKKLEVESKGQKMAPSDSVSCRPSITNSEGTSDAVYPHLLQVLATATARCHVMKLKEFAGFSGNEIKELRFSGVKFPGESHGEDKEAAGGSMGTIFMHSDGFHRLLMVLGFVGSVGDGLTLPVTLIVTGKLINNIGKSSKFDSGASFSHSVDKNAVMLCYVMFGAWCVYFLDELIARIMI
ncbi:hypothetical protein Drorol1_Dr00021840 [Drosera rotundifolia]